MAEIAKQEEPKLPTKDPQWRVYLETGRARTIKSMLDFANRCSQYAQFSEKTQGGSKYSANMMEWFRMDQATASMWALMGGEQRQTKLIGVANNLPPSFRVLYEVSSMEDNSILDAVEEGVISTNSTRQSIVDYKHRIAGPPPGPPETPEPPAGTTPPPPPAEGATGSPTPPTAPEEPPVPPKLASGGGGAPPQTREEEMWADMQREWSATEFRTAPQAFINGSMHKAQAYRFIGLPPGLRDEVYEFVYQGYRAMWHPDKDTGNEELAKILGQAKDLL